MLQRCHSSHPVCHLNADLSFPQNARVIDCKERRLVPMVDGNPYVALSYVWGPRKDILRARTLGGPEVGSLPSVLPRTIEDALDVTIRLGFRHLWVDFYCIEQDNASDKQSQIKQMANIYSHAFATICALEAHPDMGLPGVSRLRPGSVSFQTQGSTYLSLRWPNTLQRTTRDSLWNSRAWTFQEALLSRRCLFFTKDQAYLICRSSLQAESISQLGYDSIRKRRDWGSRVNIFLAILGDNQDHFERFPDYAGFVNQYQKRNLSIDADVLDAFKGLLSIAPSPS